MGKIILASKSWGLSALGKQPCALSRPKNPWKMHDKWHILEHMLCHCERTLIHAYVFIFNN